MRSDVQSRKPDGGLLTEGMIFDTGDWIVRQRFGIGPDDLRDIRAREPGNVREPIHRLCAASCFRKFEGVSVDAGTFRTFAA